MTAELPRPLNREQLSAVFKNHEALIAFERMFQTVSITFPSTMSDMTVAIAAAALSGDMAGEKANLALALLSQIASSLDVIASAPAMQPVATVDSVDLAPRYTMDPKLASTKALSVLGDATVIPGEALPIVATADGQVLLRNGTISWTLPTAPAAGLTISTALVFALANDLGAVEGLVGAGMAVRTAVDAWALRTLQAPAAGIAITNPAGVAGDPTFALANDLAAVEGLTGTGMAARTAVDAWALRTHTGSASITIGNGDGVAGSPTYSINTTWVGQTAITTLGTITTGVWTGTAIAAINGGTGFTTYALGDTIYSDAANSLAKLAGNITTTKKFLRQTGSGAASAAPAWDTLVAGDVPTLGGNPTQTVGLTAVNGAATTYMRSDGAPALDQTIAPTWTAVHTFTLLGSTASPTILLSSASPVLKFSETDQAADEKNWGVFPTSKLFQMRAINDAGSTSITFFQVTRGTGTAISNISIGDSTNNNSYTFGSTGVATFSGAIVTPRVVVNGSTVPANGIYLPAANTVGISTNTAVRVTIDATGNVAAATSPLSKSITQVFTGVAGYRTADTTANSATLAADTDLTLTVNETGHYKIDIELSFYEATLGSGGFQFDLNSGTATIGTFWLNVIGFGTALFGNAGITSVATATGIGTVVTSNTAPSWIKATGYVNITGAGTLAIRWAQNTLLAIDPTALKKGSSFVLTKVA